MKSNVLLTALLIFLTPAAFAVSQVSVQIEMHEQKTVMDADGQTRTELVPIDNIVPGDVVVYVIHYANNAEQPASNIVLNDPVPEQMVFVQGSVKGDNATTYYSVDGGANWATDISELKVTDADGEQRSATAADVTNLRWKINGELNPGEKGQVQFAARLK